MTTLLAFLVAIAVLVVVHELGHYWAARWCGVKVLRFSVGFGKVLYARHFGKGETEWVVSAIPLGGYVKMLDEREGAVAEEELPRAFNRKPVLQRMFIVVAGPLSNLLLAILLYWLLFVSGVPGVKPVLAEVKTGTPAAMAGLHGKDTIVSISGTPTPSWQEVRWMLLDAVLQQTAIEVSTLGENGERQAHILDLHDLNAEDMDGDFLGKLGLQPYQPPVAPVIGKLMEGGAAQAAGMQVQDRIRQVNGMEIVLWDDFVKWVREHPGARLLVQVERAGAPLELVLTPQQVDEKGKAIGRIGAAPQIDRALFEQLLTQVSYPPIEALREALRKTWETAWLSLKMMAKMVMGEASLKNLSGPLTIADYAGQSAQLGVTAYLGFLALISISLGVLNLLPIPLLDGGHLLYYSVELIKGSPVSEKAWQAGQNVGIAMLVTMMAFALYNDISRLISG